MKKWFIGWCVLGLATSATAQQKLTKPAKAPIQKTQKSAPQGSITGPASINLTSNGGYAAKVAPDTQQLFISDPVIRALNSRSSGANIRISGTGVVGMPRGSYGFANGQVLLRTTDATSIGGITGSGSVGTGSTPGSPGTSGFAPGVNGRNVYAGPSLWGSARGLNLRDSVLRSHPARRAD